MRYPSAFPKKLYGIWNKHFNIFIGTEKRARLLRKRLESVLQGLRRSIKLKTVFD
jgi:hypothetical protein